MELFEGRVAVVTGAANGIGRAVAMRCAAEGMKVVCADIERDAAAALVATLEAKGAEALAVTTDVSQADQVNALAERTLERFGGVHFLMNNAGVYAGGLSWEAPQSDYEWVFSVNVYGILHGLRAFMPHLLEADEGYVVNTASMAGLTATPFNASYYMSKHAALSLSETLYLEMQARQAKVGVSVLCPELIDTRIGFADRNRPEHLKRGEAEHAEQTLVEQAIKDATAKGLPPSAMAERVFEAMREERFYILPPEGDPFREACNTRLAQIRSATNPGANLPDDMLES
jgi:NAD(P)-dependent dehydrogenase (short-subunit alcohol dehydrogenase family)